MIGAELLEELEFLGSVPLANSMLVDLILGRSHASVEEPLLRH